MLRKALYVLALLALLILLLLLLPEGTAGAADGEEAGGGARAVRVVNLPAVQAVAGTVEVRGRVGVEGPVHGSRARAFDEVTVSPSGGRRPEQLVPAGTLAADGFGWVTLSLVGEVRGRGAAGAVGAVLVPDLPEAAAAFRDGRLLLPLEVEAAMDAADPWLDASSARLPVAFPRYRVYLYNTSERTVATRLVAYLSS